MSHGTVPVFRAPSTTFLPSSRDIAPRPDPGKPSRCKARCSSPAATSHQIAQTPRIGAPYPYRREATQQSLTTSHPEAAARNLARWFDSERSIEWPARLLLQAKIDMPHASNPPPLATPRRAALTHARAPRGATSAAVAATRPRTRARSDAHPNNPTYTSRFLPTLRLPSTSRWARGGPASAGTRPASTQVPCTPARLQAPLD